MVYSNHRLVEVGGGGGIIYIYIYLTYIHSNIYVLDMDIFVC